MKNPAAVLALTLTLALALPLRAQQNPVKPTFPINNFLVNPNGVNILTTYSRASSIFSTDKLSPLVFNNSIPRGAVFCRMENVVFEKYNFWFKIHAGSGDQGVSRGH
jgi:hypothetical protein